MSVPKLKDELAQDPDNPIRKYRGGVRGGQRVSWVNKTFNARHRGLGGRTLEV